MHHMAFMQHMYLCNIMCCECQHLHTHLILNGLHIYACTCMHDALQFLSHVRSAVIGGRMRTPENADSHGMQQEDMHCNDVVCSVTCMRRPLYACCMHRVYVACMRIIKMVSNALGMW